MLSVDTSEVSERPRPRDVQGLIEHAGGILVAHPVEHPIPPEVLTADERAQVLPRRVLRIRRRLDRVGPDVTEPARHPDAIRPDEFWIRVIRRLVVEEVGVPDPARLLVEVGVRKQAQAHHAGGLPVVRPDRDGGPARANLDAFVCLGIGKGVGRALRIAHVEPEPEAVRIGPGRLAETRLVDEPEIAKAVVAPVIHPRMR